MKLKVITVINLVVLLLTLFSGCKASENKSSHDESIFDLSSPLLSYQISVFENPDAEFFSVGGMDFESGITFLNSDDENPCISFSIDNKTKNISFWLGAVENEQTHYLGERDFCVSLDGEELLRKTVKRNDVAEFYSFFVEGAESITFSASPKGIELALADIRTTAEKSKYTGFPDELKLVRDIEPFCFSAKEKMQMCKSVDNQSCIVAGEEQTDVLKTYLPYISEYPSEIYSFFNLGGEYSKFSFSVGGVDEFMGSNGISEERQFAPNDTVKAKLIIYADSDIVFSQDVSPFELKEFSVNINNCKRLGIIWMSYPKTNSFCMGMANAVVEK